MRTEYYTTYIEDYIKNSKTIGAIMLTSSWGRGKSFYIDNELIKKLGKEKCVKISLYDLKTLADISKAIYLEIKTNKWRSQKSEKRTTLAFVGRTVLRGILSYFSISLSPNEGELQKLYNSIDLSGKLIIFEDVERSGIPIVEIMGYVNNLCEQDGVKVLLVANEEEISSGNIDKEEYYRIKEKTVCDTIIFDCDLNDPINNILESFARNDNNFSQLLKNKDYTGKSTIVQQIISIMQEDAKAHNGRGYNLRSLIFACQKTKDFFMEAEKNDVEFAKAFFEKALLGIIAFSLKLKRGTSKNENTILEWKDDLDSPAILGSVEYPLLKDCYSYIKEQKLDSESLKKTVRNYQKLEVKEKNWRIVKNFLEYPFAKLIEAIKEITKLVEEEIFPLEDCGILANMLISIKATIGEIKSVTTLLELIKKKIKNSKLPPYEMYSKIINPATGILLSGETKKEYESFKNEVISIIAENSIKDFVNLIDTKEGISKFRKTIDAYEIAASDLLKLLRLKFVDKININELIDSLMQCSPSIISDFANGFCKIYIRDNMLKSAYTPNKDRKGENIYELFNALPRQFKENATDSFFLSSQDKETIRKFKEAFEKQYEDLLSEKVNLETKEKKWIDTLIKKMRGKIENSTIDRITHYQLTVFIEKLNNIVMAQ